ncbi:putative glutathione transferase [Rosa chinensis]|uniref:glutathione transferase n=1 Tax=Rosa chinensis TaxID=74649 RepID=A0A2P6SD92_ROSCH|nr:probable glutathione S-transferase [Rosa chinensis]PRQ56653.1 putative glutathione transferase [Rosa chinensis]
MEAHSKKMAEVKLFRTWSSPFALRTVWALKLKVVQYDTIFEDLSNKSPLLLQYNPVHKKVPVLVHNGKSVAESFVILEYIEETWKQNPLLSEDPHERAAARFWAKFGDEKVLPSIWEAFNSEGKEQEEGIVKAKENLKYLEEELKGKKFFGGENIGFADIALGWLAEYENVFEEVASMKVIAEDEFPLLSEWKRTFADAPIIKENWPPRDKLVTKFLAHREANLLQKVPK